MDTTVKTSDFTAVAGEGYFVDTTSGAITVTLPAGNQVQEHIVAVSDYAKILIQIIYNSSEMVQKKLVLQRNFANFNTEWS